MPFHGVLEDTKIRHVNLPLPPTVDPSTATREVIRRMQGAHCPCVLVVENGRLVGIFTERDVLNRIIGKPALLEQPVSEFMTPDPIALTTEHSLGDAIEVMSEGGYRNVPIVDAEGRPVASLPAAAIVNFIVAHFPKDVYNLPPRPEQHMATPEGA